MRELTPSTTNHNAIMPPIKGFLDGNHPKVLRPHIFQKVRDGLAKI